MLEIIQDVLAAEKKAEELIEAAKKEAAENRSALSEEESKRVRDAEAEADKLVREKLTAAREEQEKRAAQAIEKFRAMEAQFESEGHPRLQQAVDLAVRVIVTGESRPQDGKREDT